MHNHLPVHFFTIVLNGMPFIKYHIQMLKNLKCEWHWHIIEGVADLVRDTGWSIRNGGRVSPDLHDRGRSLDGTSSYLDELASKFNGHVTVYRKPYNAFWYGKLEMIQAPLANIKDECLLWQLDVDEIWTTKQINTARNLFLRHPEKTSAYYYCHFFVGVDLVTTTTNTYGNYTKSEWLRTWRFLPGDYWKSHEPPQLMRRAKTEKGLNLGLANPFKHADTASNGLIFQHFAYATEAQLKFKEHYYGYNNAVAQWQQLQAQTKFPVKLNRFFAWVKDEALVDRACNVNVNPIIDLGIKKDVISKRTTSPRRIIWLRCDSIGDNVLAMTMLAEVRQKWPGARICVVCQAQNAELYELCPYVEKIIRIPKEYRWKDRNEYFHVLEKIKNFYPDLLINSTYSRHEISDLPGVEFINRRIALRQSEQCRYTDIISTPEKNMSEIDRHFFFLKGLGINANEPLKTRMWIGGEDYAFADQFFDANSLDPKRCIVLFAGSRIRIKEYENWGKALKKLCMERNFSVIALGSANDYDINQRQLEQIQCAKINLSGITTLRQTSAIIDKSRLAVGTDTSLGHIACAVDTENVILLGGAHFGRFFPYSFKTSVVCLPMTCYGCEWSCIHGQSHCIQKVHPESIAYAIKHTLDHKNTKPRVFVQDKQHIESLALMDKSKADIVSLDIRNTFTNTNKKISSKYSISYQDEIIDESHSAPSIKICQSSGTALPSEEMVSITGKKRFNRISELKGIRRPVVTSRLKQITDQDIDRYIKSSKEKREGQIDGSISLILPTKNRTDGLKDTLSSISEAMQDISYEIILYADKESEDIRHCMETYNIQKVFYDHDIFGPQASFSWSVLMNHGFSHASGQWVMYGSDDIVLYPHCFKNAMDLLKGRCDENIGGITFLHRNTAETYNGFFKDFGYDTLNGDKPFINFGLINKTAFAKTKGFDERLRFFWADVDICTQLLSLGYSIIPSCSSLVDHHNWLEKNKKDQRITLFETDTAYFHSKWHGKPLFAGFDPLEKVRYVANPSASRRLIKALNRRGSIKKAVRPERTGCNIVIDGVIFQLQQKQAGGISRVWRNLIPQLASRLSNGKITVLQREGTKLAFDGAAIRSVPAYRLAGHKAFDADDEMLRRVCRDLQADIFISTYYTRAPGVINVVMIHDMIPELFGYDLSIPEWLAKQRVIETGDAFMCVSRVTRDDLTRCYPQTETSPLAVVPNGLDACFKSADQADILGLRKKLSLTKDYVLLVGNRQGYKGGKELLKALSRLPTKTDFTVLCVGGESQPSPEELRIKNKLDLRYAGQLTDSELAAAYSGAKALLAPSKYEGFGLPVIEAMACGCPVIAEKSPAVEEVGGDAVYFADMSCTDSVHQALQKVSETTFHKEMIAKGRVRAARFNWDKTAECIDQFVKALMEQPSILLTAIVSTYNSSRFIKGCLEDLAHQSIADRLEIIVVDSASQEDEAAVVRDFQRRHGNIKYIRTTDRESVYQAWNRGIKFALGKYVSNANTDDRHRQDAFEQMVHVLEQDENIALVYADVIKTRTANETFRHCTPTGMFHWYDWDRSKLLEKGCFIGPQPVWRKTVHQDYGYFDENYEISADFEFWLRISQTNEFHHISKPLGLYMDRPGSIEHANTFKKQQEDREILQRYRQADKEKRVIGMLSQSDKHLNSECCQTQQDDANNAAQSVQHIKSTNEEITQGGHDMHSPETIFKAIEHLVANGHKEAALWVMDKLLADFPENARLHNEMAALAYEQADMPTALLHFKQAAALDPQNTFYLKNLADYYYVQEKDAENALRQYESVLNLDPNNIESLVMAGHLSISLHRYSQGQKHYQRVLDLDPQNSEVRQILEKMSRPELDSNTSAMSLDDLYATAQTKVQEGDRETAISFLEQLLARDDTHALAHNDFGVLQYEGGNLQAALEHYEKAAGLQPENETLQKNLADFYLVALKDYERAMQTYVQVLKLNPQDVEALLSCGQLCMSLGKNDDARDFIHAALETEPWNENAQHMLRRLDQPMESPGSNGTDLYERAKAKASEGDLHGAIEDLGKYVAAEPDNANAHNDLGVLYFEAGEKDKSLSAYERAVQLEPNDHTYLKNLADFYLIEQNRTEEAMKLYLRVLENNPQDIESLLASGMVCASLGHVEDATIFYNRVIEIEPWNEIAQNALNGLNPNGEKGHTAGVSSAAAG